MQLRVQLVAGVQQARQVVQAHARQVYLVVLVHYHRGPAAQDHLHALKMRWPKVVQFVPLQDDQFTDLVGRKLEWAGPVRFLQPGPVLRNLILVEHESRGI